MNDTWLLVLGFVLGFLLSAPTAFLYGRRHHSQSHSPSVTPRSTEEAEESEAKAIDPNNPPTYQVYRPRSGVSTLKCTCHEETIQPGERVLLWPIPEHPDGAMDVFCQRTYGQVGQ